MKASKNTADDTAAGWVALEDARALSRDQQTELDRWLGEDSRHFGAYMRARAVMELGQRMKAFGTSFDPDEYRQGHVEDHAINAEAFEEVSFVRGRAKWTWAGAAIAACLVAVMAFSVPLSAPGTMHQTAVGEQREMTLADASSISMNTGTQLEVAYDDDRRFVRLSEGEAIFNVERDPSRPFFVEAGNATIRVLGTVFSVRHIPGQPVEVIVHEGRVHVEREQFFGNIVEELVANERAIVGLDDAKIAQDILPESRVEMSAAWIDGMIAFEDVSLADAAAEFARYGNGRIRVDDPEIARQTITGLFDSKDPAGFAKAAALSLGFQARQEGAINIIERRTEVSGNR